MPTVAAAADPDGFSQLRQMKQSSKPLVLRRMNCATTPFRVIDCNSGAKLGPSPCARSRRANRQKPFFDLLSLLLVCPRKCLHALGLNHVTSAWVTPPSSRHGSGWRTGAPTSLLSGERLPIAQGLSVFCFKLSGTGVG